MKDFQNMKYRDYKSLVCYSGLDFKSSPSVDRTLLGLDLKFGPEGQIRDL